MAFNCADLAKLELHFLEFPFTPVSKLELATRDISLRFARQKGAFPPGEDRCRPPALFTAADHRMAGGSSWSYSFFGWQSDLIPHLLLPPTLVSEQLSGEKHQLLLKVTHIFKFRRGGRQAWIPLFAREFCLVIRYSGLSIHVPVFLYSPFPVQDYKSVSV